MKTPKCAYEDDVLGHPRCAATIDLRDSDFGWLCPVHFALTLHLVEKYKQERESVSANAYHQNTKDDLSKSFLGVKKTKTVERIELSPGGHEMHVTDEIDVENDEDTNG